MSGYVIHEDDITDLLSLIKAWRGDRIATIDQLASQSSRSKSPSGLSVACLLEDLPIGGQSRAELLIKDENSYGLDVRAVPLNPHDVPSGATFSLKHDGQETTPISLYASSGEMLKALASLSGFEGEISSVTLGSRGGLDPMRWRLRCAMKARPNNGEPPLSVVPSVTNRLNVAVTENPWHGLGQIITVHSPSCDRPLLAGDQVLVTPLSGSLGYCVVQAKSFDDQLIHISILGEPEGGYLQIYVGVRADADSAWSDSVAVNIHLPATLADIIEAFEGHPDIEVGQVDAMVPGLSTSANVLPGWEVHVSFKDGLHISNVRLTSKVDSNMKGGVHVPFSRVWIG